MSTAQIILVHDPSLEGPNVVRRERKHMRLNHGHGRASDDLCGVGWNPWHVTLVEIVIYGYGTHSFQIDKCGMVYLLLTLLAVMLTKTDRSWWWQEWNEWTKGLGGDFLTSSTTNVRTCHLRWQLPEPWSKSSAIMCLLRSGSIDCAFAQPWRTLPLKETRAWAFLQTLWNISCLIKELGWQWN